MAATMAPPTLDPLALLKLKAAQTAAPGAQGQPPSPAPMAAPAPAPVAGNGPPAAEGGGSGIFSGIGTAISNAMSGAGVFGSSAGDMGEMDPTTGMTPGMERRGNNQSLMKVGLMLIAAGQRQSDDSRAKVMASMAGAVDSGDVNQFARNRLEMAKMRLIEKKMLGDKAAADALMGAVSPGVPVTASTQPVGLPGGVPAVPATGEIPASVPPAPVPGGGAPAVPGDTPTPVPGAPAVPGAPGAAATAPSAPGLPVGPPPPPQLAEWQPNADDLAIMNSMRLRADAAGLANFVKTNRDKLRDRKIDGGRYLDPSTGKIMIDEYQGGVKVGTKLIGDAPQTVVDRPGPDGTIIRETVVPGSGQVIKRETVRDVLEDAESKDIIADVGKTKSALRDQHANVVLPAIKSYEKAVQLEDVVRGGGTYAGKLAPMQKATVAWLASLGMIDKTRSDQIQKLTDTSAVQAELGAEAGKFAKENYGPQVSDQDRKNAQELLGAIETNQPEQISAAIERIRREQRRKVEAYQQSTSVYEEDLGKTKIKNKDYFKPKKVEYNFDTEKPWEKREREAAESAKTAPAAGDVPPMPPGFDLTPTQWKFMTPEQRALFK